MEKKTVEEKNGIAVAGFICSLCGLLTCGFTSVIGLILSIIGLNKASKVNNKNKGLAIAGIVIGALVICILAIVMVTTGAFASALNDELKDSASEIKVDTSETDNSKESKQEKFSYTIDKSYLDEYGFNYYIEGSVINNKDRDYSYVTIEFICYDIDGNNIGTASDSSSNLLGSQTWKYKAIFLGSDSEKVDHCDYHEISAW